MKYLSEYMEQAQSQAFENAGAFFAFSNKQFHEKKKEGITYVNMGANLICPKDKARDLRASLDTIYEAAIKQDVAENGIKVISREYFNYECQITCDTSEVFDAMESYKRLFPEMFTDEVIKSECKKAFALAVENDWF
jgi:hypothetical protein